MSKFSNFPISTSFVALDFHSQGISSFGSDKVQGFQLSSSPFFYTCLSLFGFEHFLVKLTWS
jgi:hypothetical protein